MTPDGLELLQGFETVVLFIFAALVLAAFARMFYRLGQFIFNGLKPPRLLIRDLMLFGSFFIIFGVGSYFGRILGYPLSQNPLWVVPTSLLALAATGYWVWVEFHLDDVHNVYLAPIKEPPVTSPLGADGAPLDLKE